MREIKCFSNEGDPTSAGKGWEDGGGGGGGEGGAGDGGGRGLQHNVEFGTSDLVKYMRRVDL
jgi:hypothetical protein